MLSRRTVSTRQQKAAKIHKDRNMPRNKIFPMEGSEEIRKNKAPRESFLARGMGVSNDEKPEQANYDPDDCGSHTIARR